MDSLRAAAAPTGPGLDDLDLLDLFAGLGIIVQMPDVHETLIAAMRLGIVAVGFGVERVAGGQYPGLVHGVYTSVVRVPGGGNLAGAVCFVNTCSISSLP